MPTETRVTFDYETMPSGECKVRSPEIAELVAIAPDQASASSAAMAMLFELKEKGHPKLQGNLVSADFRPAWG